MYISRNKTTKQIICESKTPFAIDEQGNAITPIDLDSEVEILEVVLGERPPYNRDTHKLEPEITELNGVITRGFKVVPLTIEELALVQEEKDRATDIEQIKAIYLDLKNGVGTTSQRLVRVEKVLARIIKDTYQ